MSPHDPFLRAILVNPADDLPRLVYADYLEENGEPERAEFIRTQIELATQPPNAPERQPLADRVTHLLAFHRERWLGPTVTTLAFDRLCHRLESSRGFVEEVTLLGPDEWRAERLEELLSSPALAVSTLTLAGGENESLTRDHLRRVFIAPRMQYLRRLNLHRVSLPAEALRYLLTQRHLPALEALQWSGCQLGDDGARLVARLFDLPSVRFLGLMWAGLSDDGVGELAGSPQLAGLTALDLSANYGVTDAGGRAVADSPHLRGLVALSLRGTHVSPELHEELRRRFAPVVRV
jgi:uncharacterized protein (TIGR02996 family)